jgi:hypothetical protein
VYFDRFDADGVKTGELDLGNAPACALAAAIESLDHFSSRKGLKEKDLSIETSLGMMVKFTLDEYAKENINLALLGDYTITNETQPSGHQVNDPVTGHVGRYTKLHRRHLVNGTIVVTNSTGLTTYTENTDYTIDLLIGRIFVVDGGSISEDEELLVDYDYESTSYPVINPASASPVQGFLRFVGDPDQGPKYEAEFWKAKLKCTSDINFISDDWGTLEFEAELQKDEAGNPDYPWGKIREVTTNEAAGS